ncbi:MAG: DNA cytosine methyltransferase, partial [Microcystis flos-aquae Mf_QC_C_20070823_S10]
QIGLPQKRTRLFVIATRNAIKPIRLDVQLSPVTVRDAIADLPLVDNGNMYDELAYGRVATSKYAIKLRSQEAQCTGHSVTNNSSEIIARYRYIPQGGNWKAIPADLMSNYKDASRCHTGIYHRLVWDEPGKVLGNFRKNMLIHPEQHRGLSIREAARLQSFPDRFDFAGSIGKRQQQVGNAVPPEMARQVILAAIADL